MRNRWHIRRIGRARFWRGDDGISTLEFAFIAPILLIIMMGIVEFSLIMFTMAAMESATGITARLGKTGYTAPGMSREQQIVASIENRTAGLLNPLLIQISSKVYSNFDKIGDAEPFIDGNGNGVYNFGEGYSDVNGNGQWDADMGAAGYGNANDIVVYTVTYPWTIVTPIIGTVLGNPFNISVRTVVKNEPYTVQVGG